MIVIGLLAFNVSSAFADIVIKNGSSMKVSSGTEVVVSANVDVESGGAIDNSGSFTVKGDFTNDGTAALGSGEYIFNGTASQNIGGTTTSAFEDIIINNSTGVSLTNHILVEGARNMSDLTDLLRGLLRLLGLDNLPAIPVDIGESVETLLRLVVVVLPPASLCSP